MRYLILSVMLVFSFQASAAPKAQDNDFKSKKQMATLWSSIPFFAAGDLGQYAKTSSQDRDSVRQNFFFELTSALKDLAQTGAPVDAMVEPLANVLMLFDQVHDAHKATDVINIDLSLENQFKATLDRQYINHDIRDDARRLQVSSGTDSEILQLYVQKISKSKALGAVVSQADLNVNYAAEMRRQIDYISYGSFSNLGGGQFQLTYHMQGYKNGVTRNFISRGNLVQALDDLALQVFDFFQKNAYPDWQPSESNQPLQWINMPVHSAGSEYTFAMAKTYCLSQAARLPYSRELVMAATGGDYKPGGISKLEAFVSYPVADRRRVNENYTITPGHEQYTGGAIQPEPAIPTKVQFWCVRGPISAEVKVMERLWELHRQYRYKNKSIFAAVETLRFELGDSDTDLMYFGNNFERFERLSGREEALQVLKAHGIEIQIPTTL